MTPSDQSPIFRNQAALLVLTSIAAGLIISMAAYLGVGHLESLRLQKELERAAAVRAAEIHSEAETALLLLESLRSFYHASREVERGEFRAFTAPLLRSVPSLQALAWIPRVPAARREAHEAAARRDGMTGFRFTEVSPAGETVAAAERPEHFPVYYLEPLAGNERVAGLDLASDPVCRETLMRAARSGSPAATPGLRQRVKTGEPPGMRIFLPVYREPPKADGAGTRPADLVGFFLGEFRIGDMLDRALAPLPADEVSFRLEDLGAPAGGQLLITRGDMPGTEAGTPAPAAEAVRPRGPRARVDFSMADRRWSLTCFPSDRFLEEQESSVPLLAFLLCLLGTGLVAGYFAVSTRSSTRLARANRELRHEILERQRAETDLEALESLYRNLFQNVPVGIGLARPDGTRVLENAAMLRTLGNPPDEAGPERVTEAFCDPQDFFRIVDRLQSSGTTDVRQVRMRRADGTAFLACLTTTLHPAGDGQRVMTVIEDISERHRAEEERRLSEERFRAIFDGSIDAIFLADPGTGRILDANPAASSLLGRPRREIVGLHQAELHPPRLREQAREHFGRVAHGRGTVPPAETVVLGPEGSEKLVEVQAHVIQIGGVPVLHCVFHDITQRKAAEQALRESEAANRSILRAAPIGIGLLVRNELGWASERLSEMIGYPREEIVGSNPRAYYESDEAFERVARLQFEAILEHGVGELETRWRCKDGRVIDVLLRSAAIDPGDLARGITFTALDITERNKAQEDLRVLATAVAQSSDGIVVVDRAGNTRFCNPAWARMHGYGAEEILGQPLTLYHSEEQFERDVLPFARQLSRTGSAVGEMGHLRRDGTTFPALMSSTVMKDASGRDQGFITIATDITEKRRWEEDLAKVQRLESLGVLAGGIAHDFNNILTAILSNVSMARVFGNPAEDIAEMLQDAERATLRARGLTQQLLSFAKGGAPLKKPLSLSTLLKETVRFSLSGSNVRCEYDLPDDLWWVDADEAQVGQVVQNLILNADQSMAEGGVIRVAAENLNLEAGDLGRLPPGRYVKFSVRDQGSGIPEKLLSKVFDPFFTTKEKGRGLGLATTFSIVNRHGGHIRVSSRAAGAGTRFEVFLPAAPERFAGPVRGPAAPAPGGGRLLLIDDEETIRKSTGEILKRLGYDVATAREGREGIDLYRQALQAGQRFDAVILDLTIPGGMGGKQTVAELLELDPGLKAVASSGYSDDRVMADYREYGFCAMVPKPYDMEDLAETIKKVLSAPGEQV